jgi:hypothetical protein
MKMSFLVFLALQTADFLTTAIVLRLGGSESNPIVQHFITADALHGLLIAKLVAVAIGAICLISGRHRALRVTNMAFATIVAWNVTIVARLL